MEWVVVAENPLCPSSTERTSACVQRIGRAASVTVVA